MIYIDWQQGQMLRPTGKQNAQAIECETIDIKGNAFGGLIRRSQQNLDALRCVKDLAELRQALLIGMSFHRES